MHIGKAIRDRLLVLESIDRGVLLIKHSTHVRIRVRDLNANTKL